MSWEGIIIEPSEIAVQTEEMTNALEQDNESLQTALGRLTGFQTEEELSSLAWNSLKGRAAYLCLILQGLICANEAMIEDNRQLNNLTGSILGNEPFYGESIAAVLTFQQGIMETYERRVTNLQRISRRMIGARLSTALVERSLVQAKEIVSSAQQIIAQCMEQRERVEQFLSATANLYERADALYSHVAQGITALEQSGASVDSAASAMSWTQALDGAWEERRLKRLDSGNGSASVTDGKAMPHLTAGVFRVMEEYGTTGKPTRSFQDLMARGGSQHLGSWKEFVESKEAIGGDEITSFSYVNRDNEIVIMEWTIDSAEFIDSTSLTLQQITDICQENNPELVIRGYDKAIYEMSQRKGINPKVILATLWQEQGWCKEGGYDKAFGVGPGGTPIEFDENARGGLEIAVDTYLELFYEGLEYEETDSMPTLLVNYDPEPYKETTAVFKEKTREWQEQHPQFVAYMEKGIQIQPVNAAMYAKLRYTPWIDFPPQNSHPLDTWMNMFQSF